MREKKERVFSPSSQPKLTRASPPAPSPHPSLSLHSLVLIGSMLAYYFVVNRDVNKYAHDAYPLIPAEKTVVQYPGWSWYLGAASGLLWLLSGCIGCCMPARTKKVTTVV
jgi:hypothetical protein